MLFYGNKDMFSTRDEDLVRHMFFHSGQVLVNHIPFEGAWFAPVSFSIIDLTNPPAALL